LPDSYQVNDSQRQISEDRLTRRERGLPDKSFVYCCFNNPYKILPAIFDTWMRLLRAQEDSVLWLLEGHATTCANLRREAEKRGVSGERLIFAPQAPLPDHLARHRHADLFLDTLPYNAHTTASDSLWSGLPVLTQIGQTFAGRVAASLLNAIRLPELITHSGEEYEALALELARNRERLFNIREKLNENRLTTPLFDTALFTRYVETAYAAMYQRHQAGLQRDHIEIQRMSG
jgi:protein O-GlcNAc transferase